MARRKLLNSKGFSLSEILVVILITAVMLSGLISFFVRQQRILKGQRLVADMQSLGFIGFFIIGRDIRSAGSNPKGMPTLNVFPVAIDHELRMVSDLNGDGTVQPGEDIRYYHDATTNTLYRQEIGAPPPGEIAIENVTQFNLTYNLAGSLSPQNNPNPTALIRGVNVTLQVQTSTKNPATGQYITKQFNATYPVHNLQ